MCLVFNMQKCMDGVNQDCIAANSGEEWKCFMAQVRLSNIQYMWLITDLQYTYPHIKTPIFLLNARYDTWQLDNILQLHCHVSNCTEEQMKQFENFGEVFAWSYIYTIVNAYYCYSTIVYYRNFLRQLFQLSSHQLMECSSILVR